MARSGPASGRAIERYLHAGVAAVTIVVLGVLALSVDGAGATQAGGMAAMSLDLDVSGNTATSLGPRDDCLEVSVGQIVTLDVTAEGIPASNPMIAFAFALNFPAGTVTVTGADADWLLGAGPGSAVFNANEPLPSSSGLWRSAVADTGDITGETGSGVLERLTIEISGSAASGHYLIWPNEAVHVDPAGNSWAADAVGHAFLAVGASCEDVPQITSPPNLPDEAPGNTAATPTPSAGARIARNPPGGRRRSVVATKPGRMGAGRGCAGDRGRRWRGADRGAAAPLTSAVPSKPRIVYA